jgi:Protein of unknown function (DUF3237)
VKGDRLRGQMLGAAAADSVIVGPGGTGTVGAWATLQTDDGAIIFVHYNGRLDASRGLQFPMTAFETRDDRYAWRNRIQAVGKGILRGSFARLRVVRGPLTGLPGQPCPGTANLRPIRYGNGAALRFSERWHWRG